MRNKDAIEHLLLYKLPVQRNGMVIMPIRALHIIRYIQSDQF